MPDKDIATMLSNQRDIIRALTYSPSILVQYIHYRGSQEIEFKSSSISIPQIPFIPYNDPNICCIVNKIENTTDEQCPNVSVRPLGPKGKVGIPYIVTNGNSTTIAKLTKIDKLFSKYHTTPPTSLSSFIKSRSDESIKQCISDIPLNNIRYIASDEFTNETLIAYVLNYLVIENARVGNQLPILFVQHYQAGICGKNIGINIMEYCDMGTLDNLPRHSKFISNVQDYMVNNDGQQAIISLADSVSIQQILTQIAVGLNMLQSLVNFTSGDLKAGNIFIKSDPLDMKYLGITLKAPFTCKIADYGKSSCMLYKPNGETLTGIRFFNESDLADVYLYFHPFEDNIIMEDGEYYYTVENTFNSQVYTRTRHMGIPFYHSFDYYTVLVSMLTNPAFYYMFFATDILRRIFWDPIWGSNAGTKAMKRIRGYVIEGKGQSINDAINILRGLRLKCSALALVIKQLQTIE
jgi:hypothetical protein